MRRGKRRRLVEDHHRDHVLHADVRHLAVVDERRFANGDVDGHLPNVVSREWLALLQILQRVERCLNRRAYGGAGFEVSSVIALFKMRSSGTEYAYDVSADGQRFLIISPSDDTGAAGLTVAVNWTARLKP